MIVKQYISLLAWLMVLVLASCKDSNNATDEKPKNLTVSGKITGASGLTLYVEAPTENGMIPLASAILSTDGTFNIEGNITGLGFYQLRLGENQENSIPITPKPGDHLTLTTQYDLFTRKPNVSGTNWSQFMNEYMVLLGNYRAQQSALMASQNQITETEYTAKLSEIKVPMTDFAVKKSIKTLPILTISF